MKRLSDIITGLVVWTAIVIIVRPSVLNFLTPATGKEVNGLRKQVHNLTIDVSQLRSELMLHKHECEQRAHTTYVYSPVRLDSCLNCKP